jgi:TatA/E family protein of Tat protein translocase
MFGLGFTEILLILAVALLVFGPKRLPEVARSLGKSMGELRRALDEVKHEVSRVDLEPPKPPSERLAAPPTSTDPVVTSAPAEPIAAESNAASANEPKVNE